MRVNASTKRWYLDSILAPLVGPDQAKKFAQRHNIGRVGRAIGFFASLLNVGCAALENMVIFLDRNQQHAQCSGTLRLSHALLMEGFTGRMRQSAWIASPARFAIEAPRHGLQQLPGILKIAAPKQRSALASQAKGRIGSRRIVGHMHALGWRNTCFGAPDR